MAFLWHVKPVITLDNRRLEKAMAALWVEVSGASASTRPDGIVGIATGGLVCARVLCRQVPLPLFSCALRRPSTAAKSNPLARRALAVMPYGLTNWLRRLEDWLLERKTARGQPDDAVRPAEPNEILAADIAEIAAHVRQAGLRHLVVIDDAVDSGVTLGTVVSALRAALPDTTVLTTAVVAQTRPAPAFAPDVALYKSSLCRFPWSFDFRGDRDAHRD